jgi:UDP-2,3-diacylglucosamine pyrophosphatase LpxH
MLAIISDLHLTDGTSGEIISESAFRLFKNRLSDMAYDASWRCKSDDEKEKFYKPIETLDIVLLGDILDMIRTEKWNDAPESVMPWAENRGDDFFKLADEIVTGILSFNKASFDILKGIAEGDLKIPQNMSIADPITKAKEKVRYIAGPQAPVKVNIYYMIGNHDWFLYIKDPRMNAIRNKVIDALGLANKINVPFPHTRADCKEIELLQDAHRIFAEHGDGFDPTNFQAPDREKSSIGDVVVIKILNAIPSKASRHLNKNDGVAHNQTEIDLFIKELHEIDNLRPYSLAPDWITDLMKKTKLDATLINQVIGETLKEVLDDFANADLIKKDFWLKMKMNLFSFILPRKLNIKRLGKWLDHTSFSKDKPETYRKYAMATSNNKELDFFVMGHTHYAEVVPLYNYADTIDGHTRSKIYLNTGTWRTVHFKGINCDDFISFKTMTIASFYKDDERKCRTFEYWTGSLAI